VAEPRIRYAQTKDGVSMAFSAIGDGPPLVMTPLKTATTATRMIVRCIVNLPSVMPGLYVDVRAGAA
jgi:hypothetical protein